QAVLSITDGDGDIARATADLGGVLTFEDDAPTAALAVNAGATVTVDETLGQNPGEAAVGLGQVTVLGTTLFTSATTTGQDNEGATAPAFTLSIVGAGATGLFSTDNQAITLFDAGGGLIQGRYGAANTVAFTVTIDAATGNVTLTQLESLRHPTGGLSSPYEAVVLSAGVARAGAGGAGGGGARAGGEGGIGGETAHLGVVLPVEDVAPSAALSLKAGVTVVVDESLGQNGP